MEKPTNPSNDGQYSYAWLLGINLGILVLLVVIGGPSYNALGFLVVVLAFINGLIGFLFLLFERRRDSGYVGAFFLSFLLLMLIGLGMCSKATSSSPEAIPVPAVK